MDIEEQSTLANLSLHDIIAIHLSMFTQLPEGNIGFMAAVIREIITHLVIQLAILPVYQEECRPLEIRINIYLAASSDGARLSYSQLNSRPCLVDKKRKYVLHRHQTSHFTY